MLTTEKGWEADPHYTVGTETVKGHQVDIHSRYHTGSSTDDDFTCRRSAPWRFGIHVIERANLPIEIGLARDGARVEGGRRPAVSSFEPAHPQIQ